MGTKGLWGLGLHLEEMLIITHISLAGAGHVAAPVSGVLGGRGSVSAPDSVWGFPTLFPSL